mmetsp:Transcript_10156/g.15194  ORF Transcript_10156/g.15194 Transcript_10156/m.15194 type:complete len:176 (+) Transcript_10156:108-635(+)|eukprot:CAMPEP_0167760604 /NCGR_PEP_ID=MMETSP0110_2-20121227/11677_1 /TAXON_ID=629695 /ORGANISM="Gymnochlora sp., Strain CCMP2014" /LENGTH=175 /DNA_ID=CAMNT_0007647131 /DNA_START=91 /DNA_END=618 /DNA_ORIENTATION=-
MTTPARMRLIRDLKRFKKNAPSGIMACPTYGSFFVWNAILFGPDDTAWEGGVFRLEIVFTEEYPNKPPKVKFITKMFHPNIYEDGKICLDILDNQWSPLMNVTGILTSIQSLLTDPNPDSPANTTASRLFVENPVEYAYKVMRYVEISWGLNEIESEMMEEKKKKVEPSKMSIEY